MRSSLKALLGSVAAMGTVAATLVIAAPPAAACGGYGEAPCASYVVTFNPNGGSCSVTSVSGGSGSWANTPTAAQCTRTGYSLSQWTVGNLTFAPGAPFQITGNNTMTAAWTEGSGPTTPPTTPPTKPPTATAITIDGERDGQRARVSGTTAGFKAGDKVVPYLRFPGQTSYTEGNARPVIQSNGSFAWSRKTAKKVYVYFTSEDGSVRSNRVIIAAR